MDIEGPLKLEILEDHGKWRCGCYIRRPDLIGLKYERALVPLKNIDYHLEIANSLVKITLKQKYFNPTDKFLEVDYSLPISPESSIYKFVAEFNNVVIQGIVKEKEEAKKEFQKAKSQGRQAVIGTIDPNSKDILNLEIGNIPPQTQFTVTISVLQEMTISLNTFYRIQIPSTISPRYINSIGEAKKEIQNVKLGKGAKADFGWSFKIDLITTRKVIFFDSPSHNVTLLNQNQNGTQTLLVMANTEIPNKDFTFVYTTQNFHLPSYVLGNTDTSSTVMLSFIPKFCTMELTDAYKASIGNKSYETDMATAKGDYVFLLDRSGSMGGTRIEKAKEALVLFLKSLPQDSYFNVISFGSGSEKMFPTSQKYDTKKIEEAVNKIKKMTADLGGTEIYGPLNSLLNEKVQQGYPKHIFLLTDGGVSNTQGVIQMVKKNTKYCRVHSIGIGNGASFDLIQGCANSGKGKYIMIDDHENPAEKIIELLETTLTPLISKVSLKCANENELESVVPNPKSIPYILKDDVVNFYITFKGPMTEKKEFTFEYEDSITKMPYKATIDVLPSTLNQPFVDKMAHLKVLRSLENAAKDGVHIEEQMHYVKVKDYKEEAIKYSVKHQVLSEYTAFLCIGKELVDGQYQQFKNTGVKHVEVPQPEPIEYAQKQCSLGMGAPRFMAMSRNAAPISGGGHQLKMAMAPKKKSAGFGFGDMLSSVGSAVGGLFSGNKRMAKPAASMSINSIQRSQKLCDMMDQCQEDNEIQGYSFAQKEEKSIKREKQQTKKMEKAVMKQKDVLQKKAPSSSSSSSSSSKISKIDQIINLQAADGSWNSPALLTSLAKNPKALEQLCQKVNQMAVITKLVILWMQKYHPEKQYALIVKKAISWLGKWMKENGVEEGVFGGVECV